MVSCTETPGPRRTGGRAIGPAILLAMSLSGIPAGAWCADAYVAAVLKNPIVASGEPVTLTLVAEGIDGEPDLKPLLDDFEVLDQSAWSEPGNSRREWVIALRPRRDGRLRIPPLALGQQRTEAQWVQIKARAPASAAPQSAAADDPRVGPLDVLVEVSADTDTPYVQALLRYRVRVLARVPLRDATLSEPAAAGALIRRLGADRRFDLEQDGDRYRVIERLYAVVAQRAGALVIKGPTLSAAVPLRALDPKSDTDALLERRAVISRPAADLPLQVRPPPAAAGRPWLPAEAVSISERWEPEDRRVPVGEPIRRRIVIEASGVGSNAIALPGMPPVPGLQIYPEPGETVQAEVGEDLLLTTTLTQTLVPTSPGTLQLPPLQLPWWSLGMDEPRQASLPARELVAVGEAAEAGTTDKSAPTASREHFRARAADDLWGAPWLALGLALGWAATLLLWWRQYRRHRGGDREGAYAGAGTQAGASSVGDWIKRFQQACERGDAKAARDALAGWARLQPGSVSGPVNLASILRLRGAGDAEVALLRDLDASVYGRAEPAGPWDGRAFLAAVGPLLKDSAPVKESDTQELPPLFPEPGMRS